MADILRLPDSLDVGGRRFEINADFRPCLRIMQVFESEDFADFEKIQIMLGILYDDPIPDDLIQEAVAQAVWFLDCGADQEKNNGSFSSVRLFSWEQDLRFIISAVDKSAGFSVRSKPFYHWWDFISAFYESGDCVFNTIVHQRKLKKTGKQDKYDKQWWQENKDIAELKVQPSASEQAMIDRFNALLEGGKNG